MGVAKCLWLRMFSKPQPQTPRMPRVYYHYSLSLYHICGCPRLARGLQEAEKLVKGLEDPEFRRLFFEYARELQEPALRAENERYIRSLEAENPGALPAGVQLVHPEPGFAVRTHSSDGQKVFINICHSTKMEPPRIEDAPAAASTSQQASPHKQAGGGGSKKAKAGPTPAGQPPGRQKIVHLPNAAGPPRYEKDDSTSYGVQMGFALCELASRRIV